METKRMCSGGSAAGAGLCRRRPAQAHQGGAARPLPHHGDGHNSQVGGQAARPLPHHGDGHNSQVGGRHYWSPKVDELS